MPQLIKLSNDKTVPQFATHLVYLTASDKPWVIEKRIVESILYGAPKRADLYWLMHIEVDDSPYTMKYSAEVVAPEDIVFIKFKLGFRVVPRMSLFFQKVVTDLVANKEITIPEAYYSCNADFRFGDVKFVVMKSFLSFENELSFWKNILMKFNFILDKLSLPDAAAYGLDYNNVVFERVPLVVNHAACEQLTRL